MYSLSVLKDANSSLLFATEKGFGKRTKLRNLHPMQEVLKEYCIQTSEKTGNVLVSRMVNSEDEIMLLPTVEFSLEHVLVKLEKWEEPLKE